MANIGTDPSEVERAMVTEINKVKAQGITDAELDKLKNQVESGFVQSNGTMRGIAESLANYHMYYGDANLINTEIDRYMAVTAEDIKRPPSSTTTTTAASCSTSSTRTHNEPHRLLLFALTVAFPAAILGQVDRSMAPGARSRTGNRPRRLLRRDPRERADPHRGRKPQAPPRELPPDPGR